MTILDDMGKQKTSSFCSLESERRFRMALANSPIVVFEQDLNLRYTWIHNPKLGYKVPEVIGKTDADVMDSAYAAHLTEIKRGVIDTGKPIRKEVVTAPPGGQIEYYDLCVEPLRDEVGGIIGVICAATDITERKKAAQALQLSDHRFRLAMEMNATSCFSLDRDLRFTGLHASQVGFGGEDGVGKTEYAHFTEESADRVTSLYRQVLESGERRRQDMRIQSLFKSDPQDFEIVVEPLRDDGGRITGLVAAATDITERKRAEESLRESERRKSFLLGLSDRIKSLDDPVKIMAAAGEWLGKAIGGQQVVYVEIDEDQAFATISHEWNAGPMPSNVGVHRLVDFDAYFVADLKAGKTVVIEDIARDPRTFSDLAQVSFRALSIGAIVSVPLVKHDRFVFSLAIHSREARHWSALDVSFAEETAERVWDSIERARSAQQALASRAMLEAALSAMTDAVFISDTEGHLILSNEAFAAFHRFASREECFPHLFHYSVLFQIFTPDGQEAPPAQWPVSRALQGETVDGAELGVRRRDTGETWLASYSFAPIRNEVGAIVGSVVTARDITEKRKAEQDLLDSRRRFKAVFDTSMEGIITIDKRGIIQAANPATAAMFGYETHEMLGHNISMLMPEPDRVGHDSYVAQYPRTNAKVVIGHRRKLKGLRKNGEIFPNEITITDASDNRDGLFIGFIRDLTQIENEMRQAEAARAELLHVARLSDMSEVAAALAHEVSQPLTAILNFASAGRRALSSTTDPSIARVIEVIATQAKNATDILKRLRGFIEKRESQRYPENLAKLIEDALALAAVRSDGKRMRIMSKLSPDDIDVNVDRVQILQLLLNFLRNASDATADQLDPEVVIEIMMKTPGIVRVDVSDNGAGVDPIVADRLFTPFVTTKSSGMGIGLSLCKSIIESHNGAIGCAANTPKGATFWFTLPIVERK